MIIGKSEKAKNDCHWKNEKQKQKRGLKESWGKKKEFSEIDDVVSDVNVFFFLFMNFNFLFLKLNLFWSDPE